ncbi:hypothetical protein ACROSR_01460 [Roseovarius tibetensis]|uniref:hypothetical protein n=1 Tax=Roseovarius tibetensis TaxID=2685897 RepID=UPI003D7F506F
MIRAPLVAAGLSALVLAAGDATAQHAARQSRAPLGEAIRDALIATPEVLSEITGVGVARPVIDLYGADVARDLGVLERAAPRLFDPAQPGFGPEDAPIRIAIFTRADCPDCASALADLRDLANRMRFRATIFDIEDNADLARDLGLDMAPSYVMRDKMLRGAMPSIVLERYLSE